LQSVPVLIQSVSSRSSATDARRSPLAVTFGSRNFAGSSGRAFGSRKGERPFSAGAVAISSLLRGNRIGAEEAARKGQRR